MSQQKDNKKLMHLMYIGRRESSVNGKPSLLFMYVDPNKKNDLLYGYTIALGGKGKRAGDVIGGIYEGQFNPVEHTAYSAGTWKYCGLNSGISKEERAAWKAQETADKASVAASKKEIQDRRQDPMWELLKPVRNEYKKTNTAGKQAILSKILEYITR